MMVGSTAVEPLPDLVKGATLPLIPGDGGIDALEDMLALLEDILEFLPLLVGGVDSWPCWKLVITGE
jgi:hypothetical protein